MDGRAFLVAEEPGWHYRVCTRGPETGDAALLVYATPVTAARTIARPGERLNFTCPSCVDATGSLGCVDDVALTAEGGHEYTVAVGTPTLGSRQFACLNEFMQLS